MSIILTKATGADESDDFEVTPQIPVTIAAYPEANLGADVGILKLKNPDDTYDTQKYKDGTIISVGASTPAIIVNGLGVFRIEYADRASAIGVTKKIHRRTFS